MLNLRKKIEIFINRIHRTNLLVCLPSKVGINGFTVKICIINVINEMDKRYFTIELSKLKIWN